MKILKNVGFYPDEVLLVLQNNVSFLIVLDVSSNKRGEIPFRIWCRLDGTCTTPDLFMQLWSTKIENSKT